MQIKEKESCGKMFGLLTARKLVENSIQRHLKMALKNASSSASIANATADGRFMVVDIKQNKSNACASEKHKYPLVWLRDSCQCSECFHAQSKSRSIDWTKFDFKNARPKSISVIIFFFDDRLID